MITAITATNYLGESIRMELARPEKSGFAILEVTGLGPPKSNINVTEVATNDGSLFNSARAQSRNIVLNLRFISDGLIEDVRHLSYKYFPVKKMVRLLIESDRRIAETYGYVESNDVDIFSEAQATQVSIVCPDSFLYSAGENGKTVTVFYGINSEFEYPFSNESLTEKLIVFGDIRNDLSRSVFYEGDADVGFTIYITAIGPVSMLTIFNLDTRETMKIDTDKLAELTGAGFGAGDEIIISTIKGNKEISLLRNGEYVNILNCLDKNINWFQLAKGDNRFAYTAEAGETQVTFRIENSTAFEGI